MIKILKKIKTATENRTTYRVGLLQAKAYRILRQHTDKKLRPFAMTSTEWAFLGLIYDQAAGMRPGEIAEELGVEAPLVTRFLNKFEKRGLVGKRVDTKDNRATLLILTPEGKKEVKKIEKILRAETGILIKDIAMADLLSYVVVLKKIISNSEDNKNEK